MKISELIKELYAAEREHGDIEIEPTHPYMGPVQSWVWHDP